MKTPMDWRVLADDFSQRYAINVEDFNMQWIRNPTVYNFGYHIISL